MNFRILDLNKTSEQELLECIDKNIMVAKMYREEIARLKALSSSIQSKIEVEEKKEPLQPTPTSKEKDEDFEDEVDYYFEAIHSLTSKELISHLEDFLPSKKNPSYKKLMYRIQAEILREIKEVKDFIALESLSPEEESELREEITLSELKIDKIVAILNRKEEQEIEEVLEENNLIFIPTQTGRIRVFDELESMPIEYYDELYDLFSSIKNSTFKGVKRFHGNHLARVSEVKGKLMRVVFDRVDKNTYAILTMFAKKFDTSLAYRASLESVIQSYVPTRDTIIENLSNPEFVNLHKDLEIELMQKLSPSKEKPPVKTKKVTHE